MLRDVAKLKTNSNIQEKFRSGRVGPGPFLIENRKLENQEKKSLMVIGFQKKWIGWWVVVVNSIQILVRWLDFF